MSRLTNQLTVTVAGLRGPGLTGEDQAIISDAVNEAVGAAASSEEQANIAGQASTAAVAAQADIVGRIGEMRVVASNLPEWSHLFVDENRLIIAKVRRADAAMELALTEGSIIPPGTVGPAVAEVVPPLIDARFGAMSVVASDDPTYPAHLVAENLYKLISFRADGYVRLALTDDSIIPEGLVAALVEPAVQSVLTAGRVGAPKVLLFFAGDSLTAGANGGGTTYPGTMAAILGLPYVNTAVGGTQSGSIGVRQGGIPMLLNLSAALPNDTTTEIDVASYSEEFTNNQSTQQYTGTIAGHPVVLRRYSSPAPNEATTLKYTLRRTVLGSGAVVIPNGSRFEADLFADNELDVHYVQAGQNNPLVTRADRIKLRDDILRMIDRIGHDRFGIIGLKPTGPSQIIGTNGYGRKTEANAMIEDAIGWHLIRTYKYLASTGGLDDAGLLNSASQADLDCIAGDAIPPILLSDSIHGNASYYTLEGQFMARWHRGHAWLLGV